MFIRYQQELVPRLAETLGVQPQEVFYHWVIPPRCNQIGQIDGTEWQYVFHGHECDLRHQSDGRFLRIEFGPGGRFDTISGWGILQFVMTSKSPWQEFPELLQHLAEKPPPYNELSGSHEKMTKLWERIETLGYVEVAVPELCELEEKYTTIDSEGRAIVKLPDEYNDFMEHKFWDVMVSQRQVLSKLGKQILREGNV